MQNTASVKYIIKYPIRVFTKVFTNNKYIVCKYKDFVERSQQNRKCRLVVSGLQEDGYKVIKKMTLKPFESEESLKTLRNYLMSEYGSLDDYIVVDIEFLT